MITLHSEDETTWLPAQDGKRWSCTMSVYQPAGAYPWDRFVSCGVGTQRALTPEATRRLRRLWPGRSFHRALCEHHLSLALTHLQHDN